MCCTCALRSCLRVVRCPFWNGCVLPFLVCLVCTTLADAVFGAFTLLSIAPTRFMLSASLQTPKGLRLAPAQPPYKAVSLERHQYVATATTWILVRC